MALGLLLAKTSTGQVVGGPVVLLGIDPEDISAGAVENHGGTAVYISLVNSMVTNVGNGGTGILVIGGGKFPDDPDHVTAFWDAVGAGVTGHPITYVNGAGAIQTQSFGGFALIAVASSINEASGGLTSSENTALAGRSAAIRDFVDAGGGIFGLTQSGFTSPFSYLVDVGQFTATNPPDFMDITVTPEGASLGLSDALDVCCWHDEFTAFPSFLLPLATSASSGNAAAVGRRALTFQTTSTSSSSSTSSSTSTVPAASTTTTRVTTTTTRVTTTTTRPPWTTTTSARRTAATSTTVRPTRTPGTMPLSS